MFRTVKVNEDILTKHMCKYTGYTVTFFLLTMAETLDDELHDPMIIPPTSRCFCKDSTDSEEFGLVKARPSPNINIAEWWSGEGNQVNEELSIFCLRGL